MNQQWPSLADLPDAAEPQSNPAEAFDPNTASAIELVVVGLQIARGGVLDEAAELFAKAIVKEPEFAEAYEALATVLIPLNKVEFAIRAKSKAIALGYDSAQSWEMLGDMMSSIGKYEEAAEAFRTAFERDPAARDAKAKLDALYAQNVRKPEATTSNSSSVVSATADDLFGSDFLAVTPIPTAWSRVSIVTMVPDGNTHSAAFDDLADGFASALRALGIDVQRQTNTLATSGINLLLGAHLVGSQDLADRIPLNTVVINLEQITGFNVSKRPIYLGMLKRHAVWDYSVRNIVELRRMTQNQNIRHVSVGYTPDMTRNLPATEQPVDVLFYGSTNDRRIAILKGLTDAGLNVKHLFSVYGEARDKAIAEAKVVLNMHFYEDSIHEIIRTSYLLANSKAVVSECGPRTEIDDDIRQAMVAVPYGNLIASCAALVQDNARRHALERKAFKIFSMRDQAKILRDTIAATDFPN